MRKLVMQCPSRPRRCLRPAPSAHRPSRRQRSLRRHAGAERGNRHGFGLVGVLVWCSARLSPSPLRFGPCPGGYPWQCSCSDHMIAAAAVGPQLQALSLLIGCRLFCVGDVLSMKRRLIRLGMRRPFTDRLFRWAAHQRRTSGG